MSHTLTEGGQITTHRIRMFRQVLKSTLIGVFFLTLVVFALKTTMIPKVAYQAIWYYTKALALDGIVEKIEVSREFAQKLGINSLQNPKLVLKATYPLAKRTGDLLYSKLIDSLIISGLSGLGLLLFFFYRGYLEKSQKHLSGSKVVPAWRIALRLRLARKASQIKLNKLPLVQGTETQHIMITGGTGSGKTNCLHHILKQVQESGKKAIIVDTTGVFTERYFREGKDIILNPSDHRSAQWNPWAEGETQADYASMAESFISTSNLDSENYWRLASKTVFSSLLQLFGDKKLTSEIVHAIQHEKLSILCDILEGTKAAAHMDKASEKTASSVRSVASTYLECLSCLQDTAVPFSIREWMKEDTDSWLFLQCSPSERALMRPLITVWIASAIKGLLSLPIDLKRRIWFSIDELPTLHRIKDLEVLVTEGRKYGGCAILSLQSPAQLESIYGRDISKVIIGNTATKIIFRERDPEIASRISRSFGEREILEVQEGISYGAHETRDSVSLSMQNKLKPVISASQIIELPVNTAFVKLAEEEAIAKIKLRITT